MRDSSESSKGNPKKGDEEVLKTIEDLRSEVRELRSMVNMLVEMLVNIENNDDMDLDVDPGMMNYDPLLKSGKYCM